MEMEGKYLTGRHAGQFGSVPPQAGKLAECERSVPQEHRDSDPVKIFASGSISPFAFWTTPPVAL